MQSLGTLGAAPSVAWGVNADGSVVVGRSRNAENRNHAFRWTCSPCISANLNNDGQVDGSDLAQLISQWAGPGTADLNADGIVDTFDLAIVLAAWN